jgi:predicted MFS family arabinose efflux permease
MVFLVDFVARGLARGIAIGAAYWVVYGLGAMLGPLLAGRLADRIGFALALRCGLALEAVAVILPAFDDGAATLVLSSAVVGALTPGIVPLALGRSLELAAPFAAARETAWRRATIAFALLQAAAAYLFSAIYGWTGDYALLFELAALAGALAFLLDLLNGLRAPARGVATTTGAARAPRRFRRPSGAGRGSSPPPP